MPFDDRTRGGNELIVQRLDPLLRNVFDLGEFARRRPIQIFVLNDADAVEIAHKRLHQRHIDLVERQPILDFILEPLETRHRIPHEQIDGLSTVIAVIFFDELKGHLVVIESDERLDAMLFALVDHILIELEPRLIGLSVVAVGKYARPVDRETEAFEAHFCKQRDILFVVMIEVDCLMRRIEDALLNGRTERARSVDVAAKEQVGNREALTVFEISALKLIGSGRAAPQEIFRECHLTLSFRSIEMYASLIETILLRRFLPPHFSMRTRSLMSSAGLGSGSATIPPNGICAIS